MSRYQKYLIHYIGLSVPIIVVLAYFNCMNWTPSLGVLPLLLKIGGISCAGIAIAVNLAVCAFQRSEPATLVLIGDADMLGAVVTRALKTRNMAVTNEDGAVSTYESRAVLPLFQRYARWLTGPVSVALRPECVVVTGPGNILRELRDATDQLDDGNSLLPFPVQK